jgi:hypothetical protein
MAYNPFTDEEKEVMRTHYVNLGAIGVAELLTNRSSDTVKQWAHKNGLRISKELRSKWSTATNLKFKRNMSAETRKKIGDGHRKHKPFTCQECGKKIAYYATHCWECHSHDTAGAKNNNWRGGVSSLTRIVTTALKDIWKIPILIRDEYTCQKCGAIGSMEVHHVRRYVAIRDAIIKANPRLSLHTVEGKFELAKLIVADHKLEDGITLCKKCHKSIHRNKRGELLENPEKGNQQPSRSNVLQFVDRKVQRAIGEDGQSNKPDTSAPHVISPDNAMMCSELHVYTKVQKQGIKRLAITTLDGKKAVDIYFSDCFLLDWLMKQKNGLFRRYDGGRRIRIPLMYDGAEGGFYSRSDKLNSTDRENINAAYFWAKHAFGNATVYRTDELENTGAYAEVELVTMRLEGAQKRCTKDLADNLYNAAADTAKTLTGLRAMTSETSTTAYGGIAEDDLEAVDGTKPWEGKTNSTAEAVSLDVIRTLRSDAKIGDGANGRPDIVTMNETPFNVVKGILQAQQRFTQSSKVSAGFVNLEFEGAILVADDFVPGAADAWEMFALNSKFVGFAIHKNGYFVRTPWVDLLANDIAGKSLKIFWDGNLVCSNRKAHKRHSALTV